MYDGESFTPLFEEYRFFNVQSSVKRFDVESSPDPEVKERFLVPCGPLTITAVVTDAERGSMGRLTASVH